MKICYLVLLHHKFDQAKRLIYRLAGPQTSFVIHIDAKVDQFVVEKFKQDIGQVKSAYYTKRINVKWGAFNQAEAIMETIVHAVDAELSCDRFILISGQDYPIVSNDEIFKFISNNPHKEYIEAYALNLIDDKTKVWTPFYRFMRYHFWLGNKRISTSLIIKKVPNIPLFHGATWWLLTSECVHFIASAYVKNKDLKRFFRTGFLVDEAYIPSLVMSSPFSKNVTGHNVTYADWKNPSGPHPKTLGKSNIPDIVSSKCLFARKLDLDFDAEIFDLLDSKTLSSV